ncbi:MAG: TIGR01212 family radical SAM protein [Bacillota bacterium]|nr:TIGR01212 family radical SAM protein [Bacillota bacterium]
MNYFAYSKYLKNKYGEKVYKLPINIETTCPNRDGALSYGGCTFCGEVAAGFEILDKDLKIKEQLEKNKGYIKKKYKAEKYIAYFQNYTSTYIEFEIFKRNILESIIEDVVEISISTRPDAIDDDIIDFLSEVKKNCNVDITIELGLQSVNYRTLKKVNRGHTLAEFIDAVHRIKAHDLKVCAHMIPNLPWDTIEDVIEGSKILSSLKVDFVKLHSLYILKDTVLGNQYLNDEISIITKDEYVDWVIIFLRYLDPAIAIERLLARAPEDETLFCNWGMSWWKIRDEIIDKMEKKNYHQGDLYNYLNGSALKKFR